MARGSAIAQALSARVETGAVRLSWRAADALALDARSVAMSRVALGVLLLLDLRERASLLVDFYTDGGFVPRPEAIALWARLMPNAFHPWSLHLLSGSAPFQAGLLVLEALSAVMLIAGLWPRIAAGGACLLLLSLCQRDVLVTGGDDWMLAAFLFWAAFIELDRKRAPVVRSLGATAFTAQLFMVLFFAGLQKVLSSEAWRGGHAVRDVLQDVPATGFGLLLGKLPPLVTTALNYGALAAELVAPWFLVLPVSARVRALAVLYIVANLLGFAAALDVGRLPWVALAALAAELPSAVWDGLGVGGSRTVSTSGVDTASLGPWTWVGRTVLLAALFHAFAYNVARLRSDTADPAWLEAPAGVLVPRQGWGMFRDVGAPAVAEWIVVAGLRRGDAARAIRLPDRAPLSFGPESRVNLLQGNLRWGYFWARAPMLARDYPDVLRRFMQSQCDVRAEAPLERIEIVRVTRSSAGLTRETIAAHGCATAQAP